MFVCLRKCRVQASCQSSEDSRQEQESPRETVSALAAVLHSHLARDHSSSHPVGSTCIQAPSNPALPSRLLYCALPIQCICPATRINHSYTNSTSHEVAHSPHRYRKHAQARQIWRGLEVWRSWLRFKMEFDDVPRETSRERRPNKQPK
jgi:hypothetical protein